MRKSTVHHLLLGSSLFAILVVAGYLIFVQTSWGQSFDYKAYFGHQDVSRAVVRFDRALFTVVKIPTLILVALVLIVIGAVRRRLFVGVLAAVGLAMAVGGAELLKHELPRPELSAPTGRVPAVFHRDTYPSGHTSFAMGIALAFLLVSPVRWRPCVSVLGGLFCGLYATGVVMVGGHRPSDPLGAIFWSALCLSIVAAIPLILARKNGVPEKPNFSALSWSAFLALAMFVAVWVSTGWAGLELSEHSVLFLLMMSVIVFSAFSVTAWFGWVLSSEEDLDSIDVKSPKAELSFS